MAKQFTLGKNERLKSRRLIERLFKEGKSFNAFPYRVFYLLSEKKEIHNAQYSIFNIQFGAGVSNKNFKRAVDRNRIKRLIKEAWRLQKNTLADTLKEKTRMLSVFFIYTQKELPDYPTIYDKTSLIIKKLAKLIHETDSPNT